MLQIILAIVLLALFGAASIVAGVYLLAGPGWALIGAGLFCVLAALALRMGLKPNG